MRFEDTLQIASPRQRVWEFLLDPQQVGSCGPGVESIEVADETHFRAVVKVGIGQFRARFNVNLELVDLEPTESAGLRVTAQAPGTAVDATARMRLQATDETSTEMAWEADVAVSGQLAAIGSRLIGWTANKLIGQTFACVQAKLAEPAEPATT